MKDMVLSLGLSGMLDRYGYFGVAGIVFIESFGIPAPGETAIIAGAVYAGHGHLNIYLVALGAFLAAVVGDSLGYLIGRTGGHALILRFGRYVRLTPERLDRVTKFMERQGPKVVAIARFIEGLRQFNGVVAGATGMPWGRFLLFNAIGAAAWVGVWSAAGYFAGDHINAIEAAFSRYQWYAIAAFVLAIVGYLLWHRRRRSRSKAVAEGPPADPQ